MVLQVWSTISPEYGTFNWLRREISLRAGYDTEPQLLGRTERAYVDSVIESGLHQFAFGNGPTVPMAPSEEPTTDAQKQNEKKEAKRRSPHRWSFLTSTHQFDTEIGQNTYSMPEDYAATLQEPATNRPGGHLAIVEHVYLSKIIASTPSTGKPKYVAVNKTSFGGAQKQTSKLVLYPTPDAIETISFEYGVLPPSLDAENPHLPGGKEHAETVLASCLFVLAERKGSGLQEAANHFRDRLTASVVIDRQSAKPTSVGVWPDDDGKFNAAYLSRMVGEYVGAGPTPDAWTHAQSQKIAEILRRTLRRVYNPVQIPGEPYPHEWTFLRPLATLTTISGQEAYDLPRDFAELYGPMTHASASATLYPHILVIGETEIRQLNQRNTSTARPLKAAIRVKNHDNEIGTRWQLVFWPIPDQVYEIDYRYVVNPDSVLGLRLPANVEEFQIHGGDRYSQMYLEAAFLTADEMEHKARSSHEARYLGELSAAVGRDRKQNSAENLGYNSDRSSFRRFHGDNHDLDENIVTYTGYTP